jgi:hypothetical protein
MVNHPKCGKLEIQPNSRYADSALAVDEAGAAADSAVDEPCSAVDALPATPEAIRDQIPLPPHQFRHVRRLEVPRVFLVGVNQRIQADVEPRVGVIGILDVGPDPVVELGGVVPRGGREPPPSP